MKSFLKLLYGIALDFLTAPTLSGPGQTTGVHVELGSGYNVEAERAMKAEQLKALAIEIVTDPGLESHDITGDDIPETFCNRAVQRAAGRFGCSDFGAEGDQVSANQIARRLSVCPPGWSRADAERAARHAQRGGLAIAAKEYEKHGHVALIAPESCSWSGSFGKLVPMVANVGRPPNGIKKVSAAFPPALGEPDYFTYGETA